tara:strand:- start:5653 stop:7002 length:1350 start_codon:yes stop_codon:yes gene_type:complete
MMPNNLEAFNPQLNFNLVIIAFFNIIVFFKLQYQTIKSFISIELFFVIGFIIVHFQIPFLASIGIEPVRPDLIWINKRVVNFATWLSVMSLLIWFLGNIISLNRPLKKVFIKRYKVNDSFILGLASASLILFIAIVGNEFLSGNYNGNLNWNEGANYIFLILKTTLYLAIIYAFMNLTKKKSSIKTNFFLLYNNKILTVTIVIFLLVFFLAGDRGPIIQVSLLIIACYSYFVKRVKFRYLSLIFIFGGAIMILLSLGRSSNLSINEKNILTRGYDNYKYSDISFNPTNELATSNRILYRAINEVPDKHPYLNGLTFGMAIANTFPFVSSSILSYTSLPDMYRSSSAFFTFIGQGANNSWGEGSEILGDIYINFGTIGVLVIIFIFGYFIGFITKNIFFSNNPFYLIIFFLIFIESVYINRSHVLAPIKIIFYALLLDAIFVKYHYYEKK